MNRRVADENFAGEDDGAVIFIHADQMTGGVGAGSFAERFVLPLDFSGEEVLACPAAFVGVAVDFAIDDDDAAVVIGDGFFFIDDLGFGAVEFDHLAAGAITGGGVDAVVVEDESGDDGDAAGEAGFPEQGAVFGGDAYDFVHQQLGILWLAIDLDADG